MAIYNPVAELATEANVDGGACCPRVAVSAYCEL